MTVSFRSELFASYILTILSSETFSRKYKNLSNIVLHECKKHRKNEFVENVWPVNSAFNSQLTRWCRGNASALGASGPGFNSRMRIWFLYLIVYFVVDDDVVIVIVVAGVVSVQNTQYL